MNCEKEEILKQDFQIKAFPTLILYSAKHGVQSQYEKPQRDAESMAAWARQQVQDWRWLFSQAHLQALPDSVSGFQEKVVDGDDLWVVMFSGGEYCAACKSAKKNALRLSADLRGLAQVGLVDCSLPTAQGLCTDEAVPRPLPQFKLYPYGPKRKGQGEWLFERSDLPIHLGLELTAKLVSLRPWI